MCLLDRGTILIEANDRIRFGSFKVECKPVDENSHRFSSVFLPCLLHITFFFIKKKEKRKKKKERKTIVPRSWNTFSNRSFNVSYLAEESVKR